MSYLCKLAFAVCVQLLIVYRGIHGLLRYLKTMNHSDKAVTIHPYFKVSDEKLQAFKRLAEDLIEVTRGEMGCLFYSFSYADGEAYCREGYKDAASLVSHFDNVNDLLQKLNSISELVRLEVHGPHDEILKLREWPSIKQLNPKYYFVEGGFRN